MALAARCSTTAFVTWIFFLANAGSRRLGCPALFASNIEGGCVCAVQCDTQV